MNKANKVNKGFMLLPVLLLVAVLLSAAAYLLLSQSGQQSKTATGGETRVLTQEEVRQITAQAASDEVRSIEEDIGATDLGAADLELTNLEQELNAALQE